MLRTLRPHVRVSYRRAFSYRPPPWRRNDGAQSSGILYGILGVNAAVFLAWNSGDWQTEKFMRKNFTLSRQGIFREGRLHTVITHFFSHRDFWHLGSNAVSLWFFGQEALFLLGPRRFLALYLGGGLFSAAASLLSPSIFRSSSSWFHGGQHSPYAQSLGASGAVSSVVLWSILSSPYRTVFIFPLPLPLPAWFVGLAFIGQDLYGTLNRPNSQTGHSAHLGGALWGAATFALWRRR